ncbi:MULTISPECIES: alpha/beta hydrolase [Mesoflavibacter]|uniref:Alpha/beta hydrolase n=1 Tax=Mesoflavibacter profundi TaxID=2708110 RepID=A0ABT4S1Y9_9FLAO|nr:MULTISPECIES: alpha/beta hydrolase [Mesoflavibacter]MDA0177775.1 alpha/beta hydrolase [Mesoflavibacter profundi]QIJ88735.1 Esterase [Mesoflavibacter sp. HG96]QIJ91463.1 Esterase [Mesoflavibacter sp. HG37]
MKHLTYLIFFISLFSFSQKKETYIYAIKGKDTLKLDIYKPRRVKKNQKLPVFVWMHGGGFSGGTRDNKYEKKLAKYVAKKQGYVSVSISYRLLRKGTKTGFGCNCSKQEKLETFKQAAIDYLDAVNYLITHSDKFNIDTSKIIAGGSSAGAEGVLNAVYMKPYFIEDLEPYNQIKFAGVMSCAGAMVDANYISDKNAIPTVMLHGTKDPLVPFDNAPHHFCKKDQPGYIFLDGSNVIANKLHQLNSSYYFKVINDAGHEIAGIPFKDLKKIFEFFNQTIIEQDIVQTKIFKTKK